MRIVQSTHTTTSEVDYVFYALQFDFLADQFGNVVPIRNLFGFRIFNLMKNSMPRQNDTTKTFHKKTKRKERAKLKILLFLLDLRKNLSQYYLFAVCHYPHAENKRRFTCSDNLWKMLCTQPLKAFLELV